MIHFGKLVTLFLSVASSVVAFSPPQSHRFVRPTTKTAKTTSSLNLMEYNHGAISDAITTMASTTQWLADAPPEAGGVGYSQASYYTILGLYVLSFPGVWSQVKRSTSAKIKRKTFVNPGENAAEGKTLRQQAGEIMAYMKANNYEVVEAGETITFRGVVQRSAGQAAFLVFCTTLGLLSLGLVLDIQFHDLVLPVIGKPNWFFLALFSPYAGVYYWSAGDRVDDCSVKLSTNKEETENEMTVQGSDEELERMWRALEWQEKGMVQIPGLLDQ